MTVSMVLILWLAVFCIFSFGFQWRGGLKRLTSCTMKSTKLSFSNGSDGNMKENMMTVDEIKAELELRGVDYSECLSRQDMIDKLIASRAVGRANPSIIDKFNEASMSSETLDDALMQEVIAKDGNLPGGLSPQILKALSSDPQIMRMLSDPKMQDMMKAVMTGGPNGIKKYLSDPDALRILERLNDAMRKATGQ